LLLYCARSPETRSINLLRRMSCFFLLVAGPWPLSSAADPPPSTEKIDPVSQEEIVQRILDLRRQIEDLLEILPDDVRQEVEQRWLESLVDEIEGEEGLSTTSGDAPQTEPDLVSEAVSADEPASEPPPGTEGEASVPEDPVTPPPPPPCGGFHLFDSNEDMMISGGDRQWRFLHLWFDDNGNGAIEESEIHSPFELGVRQIDVALGFYVNDQGESEDVDVDDLIWLRMVRKGQPRSGALVVDADRLVKDGRLWLTDASSGRLSGLQPLDPNGLLATREGAIHPLFCQEPQ
jgi:hypothetical protein